MPDAQMPLTVCLPWHLRFLAAAEYSEERACIPCGARIAAPAAASTIACLYCAMEHRAVRMIEPGTEADIKGLPTCFRQQWVSLESLVDALRDA